MHALADACGLSRQWRNVEDRERIVADDVLVAVLDALGHAGGSERQIKASLRRIQGEASGVPALLVSGQGETVSLPFAGPRITATGEDGAAIALAMVDGKFRADLAPGYYDVEYGGAQVRLAIAPPHCPLPDPARGRPWGTAVQIPALVGREPRAFGTFGELAEAAETLAARGADALAINPVHALFPGHGYSPYSPSSRQFLNGALADPALIGLPPLAPGEVQPLIDWDRAMPRRLQELRGLFSGLDPARRARIAADCAAQGEALLRHALFDALDCRLRPQGAAGWQDWLDRYRDPASASVAEFARENAEEVEFHAFVQWLARASLSAVQSRAKASGMGIGLIGDLAVGVDRGGSDTWAMRTAMLDGLTIGAPPDPLGPLGQNWTLTGFSPEGLRCSGYAPWLAMLRAALADMGGLRIDHAFGLARLWVIPAGGSPHDGAYLTYPLRDLLNLATLEAHRAGALIVAEDLGTAPAGFAQAIAERHMLGMRVLWFERAADHGFIGAADYAPLSVAMTGTHDTQTVAGWWRGGDLDWAERLGRLPAHVDRAEAENIRAWDRGLLWATIGDGSPRPEPAEPAPVVDAAVAHIARTPSALALVPLEDLLGEEEQPNLPGTITEHPNWRRRHPAPFGELIDEAGTARRLDMLDRGGP